MATRIFENDRTFAAELYLDGAWVGSGELRRTWQTRLTDVPNASGPKESVIEQQAYLVLEELTDVQLVERLRLLCAATLDHDLGRKLRDSGQRTVLLQLQLQDGSSGAVMLSSPFAPYGQPVGTPFPASLDLGAAS